MGLINSGKTKKKMGKGGFTPEERVKSRDSQKRTIAAQKVAMLKSLSEHYCVVKYAAKEVGIDRGTHARWMEKDEAYRDAVMRLQEENIDIAENALMKAIEKGDNVLIKWYLETKGASRGYGRKLVEIGAIGGTTELADIPKIVWVKSE